MAKKTILELLAKKASIDAEIRKRRVQRANKLTLGGDCSIIRFLRKRLEKLLAEKTPHILIDDLLDQIEAQFDMIDFDE